MARFWECGDTRRRVNLPPRCVVCCVPVEGKGSVIDMVIGQKNDEKCCGECIGIPYCDAHVHSAIVVSRVLKWCYMMSWLITLGIAPFIVVVVPLYVFGHVVPVWMDWLCPVIGVIWKVRLLALGMLALCTGAALWCVCRLLVGLFYGNLRGGWWDPSVSGLGVLIKVRKDKVEVHVHNKEYAKMCKGEEGTVEVK